MFKTMFGTEEAINYDIGSLHKPAIWSVYIIFNFTGSALCVLLMRDIYKKKIKVSNDVFIFGLCSGCTYMSLTCGFQCLISVINGMFYGGDTACWLEAWYHVSAILVEFSCVTFLSLRAYFHVVYNRDVTVKVAVKVVVVTWVLCLVGTLCLGLVSPIYLVSNGTYCFYQFKSAAILWWLVLGLLIAIVTMTFSYTRIYIHMKRTNNNVSRYVGGVGNLNNNELSMRMVKRATLFVIAIFICWGSAAVTAVYEYSAGEALPELVTAVGVGGTFYTVTVPLIYGYTTGSFKFIVGSANVNYARNTSSQGSVAHRNKQQRQNVTIDEESLRVTPDSEFCDSSPPPQRVLQPTGSPPSPPELQLNDPPQLDDSPLASPTTPLDYSPLPLSTVRDSRSRFSNDSIPKYDNSKVSHRSG